jgi:Prokaryotic N-terminal methylation motif
MLHFFARRLKELHEAKADERGFTLIELIVVITLPFHKLPRRSELRPN